MQSEPLVLNAPFELWREDGVLHLTFNRSARIGMWEIKEILRLVCALDPVSEHPLLVHSDTDANVSNDARSLLMRLCRRNLKRTIGYVANTLSERISGDLFALFLQPNFPFKVFSSEAEAFKWLKKS